MDDEKLLSYEVRDSVCIITLGGNKTLEWGTAAAEHRINPLTVSALNAALDRALSDETVQAVVVGGRGKFFSNGMDLKYIDAFPTKADELQSAAERLMARILSFPLPTVAAINGHFTAAGAMLGLAFDYRVMNRDRGYFFVPAVDIGLVYSPGQTALMKAKTPQPMHRDMIAFARRYKADDLVAYGVVEIAVSADTVAAAAYALALELRAKGRNALYRQTLHRIKRNLYKDAITELTTNFESMGWTNKPKGIDRTQVYIKKNNNSPPVRAKL